MSGPVFTESTGSQKRRLSVRRHPGSQRLQYFRPIDQEPRKTEVLDNSTSHSHMFNADHGGDKQYASSWVDVADELTVEHDNNVSPPNNVDKRVASTSQDTTGGVQQPDIGAAQTECERSAMPKSYSSLAGMANIKEEGRIAPGRVRDKIQRAKTYTIRSFNGSIPRFRRRYPGVQNDPTVTASVAQLALPSSIHDKPLHSQTTQFEKEEGKRQMSADAKDSEQNVRESQEIKKLRRDLAESYSRIAELQKRLEAQSRDLESSNSFLNTADKSSDSDVIRALQRLNAEVQQNTTYMADCLAQDFEFENLTMDPTKEQICSVQRVSRRLGGILVKSLRTNTPEDIPMLLQIALQAYFASVLCQAASSWAFEPGHNTYIREIYQRLRRVEAQAISGRWRSLARVHNVHSWLTHPESLVKGILTDISDIMLAAGCTAPQSDIITKVASKFEEKISLLVELDGGLCKMFDEVISSDFGVFIARPGEKFNDKTMEDADDGQAGMEEASVLCVTHIGLTKRVPVGTLWEKGKKQKMMVLKAKVLLESFLNTELED